MALLGLNMPEMNGLGNQASPEPRASPQLSAGPSPDDESTDASEPEVPGSGQLGTVLFFAVFFLLGLWILGEALVRVLLRSIVGSE